MDTKLIQGDCRIEIKGIPDKSVHLAILDPPYIVTNEKWDKEETFDADLVKELFRIAKDSCSIYIWCGIGEKSQSLLRWFPLLKEFFYFKDLITWKKQRGIGMRKGWLYVREEIMWFVKDNKKFVWNKEEQYDWNSKRLFSSHKNGSDYHRWSNVWTDIGEINPSLGICEEKVVFPCQKPRKALERLIRAHTKEGDMVFDCFMGSGSTGVAAKHLNRSFLGIEIDPTTFAIAERRIGSCI